MEVVKLYDYVEEDNVETGIEIAIILETDEATDIEDTSYLPESFEDKKQTRRIATYISWYTEVAWLFVEEHGIGTDKLIEILEELKQNKIDPYEFQEISYRAPNQIKITELEKGFKVMDRKEERYFTTENSSNPQKIDSNNDNS